MWYPIRNPQKGRDSPAGERVPHTAFLFIGSDTRMQDFITVVQNLGIPMACLIATFWLWNKERDEHKEAEEKMIQAIHNNTLVMQRLIDKLDGADEK